MSLRLLLVSCGHLRKSNQQHFKISGLMWNSGTENEMNQRSPAGWNRDEIWISVQCHVQRATVRNLKTPVRFPWKDLLRTHCWMHSSKRRAPGMRRQGHSLRLTLCWHLYQIAIPTLTLENSENQNEVLAAALGLQASVGWGFDLSQGAKKWKIKSTPLRRATS